MIAVTGASGKLGQHVIQNLIKKVSPSQVVALVRNPEKAQELKSLGVQVRKADYDIPESWGSALKGVKKLLLISSNEIGKRETQHKVVIAAAKAAKVEILAYTSILKANTSTLSLAKEHLATETAIKESQLPYVFLRNGWYLENHTENFAPALEYGVIQGAAGSGRFSSASREDYALAAVEVLTGTNHNNKIYELAGNASFTLSELAIELAKQVQKPIVYKDMPFSDYKGFLVSVGVPDIFADMLANSDVGASKGDLHSDAKDLSNLIGRPTTLLSAAIAKSLK